MLPDCGDPLVNLGVLDACGLHKGAYLADCCEQIGFGTRELDLDAVVGGHAAVLPLTWSIKPSTVSSCWARAASSSASSATSALDTVRAGCPQGTKPSMTSIASVMVEPRPARGIDELLLGIHNGPFDGSIVLGENIRDAIGSKVRSAAHIGVFTARA